MKHTYYRVAADVVLAASVLFLPWWVTAVFAAAFLFVFETYIEAVIAGFVMDALYGYGMERFGGFEIVATTAAALLFFISLYAKSVLRYYR